MEPEQAVDKRARNGFLFYGVDDLLMQDCKVVWDKEHPEPAWESAYYLKMLVGRFYIGWLVRKLLVGTSLFAGEECKNISLDGKILQATGGMNL